MPGSRTIQNMKVETTQEIVSKALSAHRRSSGEGDGLSLCQAVFLDGNAPEWVELIPAGAVIRGRDGRKFTNQNPQAVLEAFALNGADLPLDWEHSTELKAPNGDPAPAAAWITELQVRDSGSIWGRVDWTDTGRHAVETRAYRYLSPVFLHDKAMDVVALLSAGLTNSPNLHLTALNRANKESTMDREKLIALLGLAAEATDDEIWTALNRQKQAVTEASEAIDALTQRADTQKAELDTLKAELETTKATNRQAPALDKYVPRADYELALNRAATAEDKLAEQDKAKHAAEVEAAIGEATKAGKIAPASADYYRANCSTAEGLAEFQKHIAKAPPIVPESGLDGKQPDKATNAALTDEQKAISKAFGMSEEDYAKALNSLAQ